MAHKTVTGSFETQRLCEKNSNHTEGGSVYSVIHFPLDFFRVGMQMNISAVGSTAGSNGNGNKPVECT